jgi:hypothetical protein
MRGVPVVEMPDAAVAVPEFLRRLALPHSRSTRLTDHIIPADLRAGHQ